MILYLDSSALVKKYVREGGSDEVVSAVQAADTAAISVVGFAEVMAALSRRQCERTASGSALQAARREFKADWRALVRVELTEEVNEQVEQLLSKHVLRGFDAIHLASALVFARELGTAEVRFACADARLLGAAKEEGLSILPLSG